MKIKTILGILVAVVIIGVGGFIIAHPPQSTTKVVTKPPVVNTTSAYTLGIVSAHNTQQDCWSAVAGKVYDLTDWIAQHPGGSGAIISMCGIDATAEFMNQHGGQGRPERELQTFYIGDLVQ